jgi:hypothetical protein
MPHDKLLFTVRYRLRSPKRRQASSAIPRLLLHPLRLPALLLGPKHINPTQEQYLSELFGSAIGHTWREGRSHAQLDAQLSGRRHVDWSVYWVPLNQSAESRSYDGDTSTWQAGKGVLTIWPTHLACPISSKPGLELAPIAEDIPVSLGITTTGLMATAENLFDFLSAYPEPDVKSGDQPAQAATPLETNGTSPPFEYDDSSVRAESESDIDDLFSASDSPGPPELLDDDDDAASRKDVLIEGMDLDVDLLEEIEPQSPRKLSEVAIPQADAIVLNQEETTFVTEDDFDFFDSPVGADHPREEDPIVEIKDEEVNVCEPFQSSSGKAASADIDDNLSKQSEVEETVPNTGDEALRDPGNIVDDTSGGDTPEHVVQRTATLAREASEIIPSDFEPLTLSIARFTSPFASYALPTPAPTPPSLRPELLERLRPPDIRKADYASNWDLSSTDSDIADDNEIFTGAPPTPISQADDEDDTSLGLAACKVKAVGGGSGDEVEWEGRRCIGAEWSVLVNEEAILDGLSVSWSLSWGRIEHNEMRQTGRVGDIRLEEAKCTRLARELIANRGLRSAILEMEQVSADSDGTPPDTLAERGVELADLNGLAGES